MVSGKRPFTGNSIPEVMLAILNQPPHLLDEIRSDLPPRLVNLVHRLLEKDIDDRIGSARLVAVELEAIMTGEPLPPGQFEKSAKPLEDSNFETVSPEKTNNLPASATYFVGREKEKAHLNDLINEANTRLITIIGPGGMGKTRLALAVAKEQIVQENFSDGVFFVPLAPLSEPESIIPAIFEALHLVFQNDSRTPQQQLLDYCRQKSMLLIIDNFEHLLEGASVVSDLLEQASGLKIIATSRERLNLYEEQRYPLDGLPFPEKVEPDRFEQYAAVSLFLQSVRRGLPEFKPNDEEMRHLIEICRLVEGVPLGLELAASWADTLPLDEIAAEIKQSLDFLETDLRNVPTRHQSIRAVFSGSWNRLSENEQATYAQLSLFRGGFTNAAAKAVTKGSIRVLSALVNKSLLRYSQNSKRYEFHELLRQYAAQKITNEADTHRFHAEYYCHFLRECESKLRGDQQQKVMLEIEADIENIKLAWQTAVSNLEIQFLDQAIEPLGTYLRWTSRFQEGYDLIRLAVNQVSVDSKDKEQLHFLVKALTWQGVFLRFTSRYKDARDSLELAQSYLENRLLEGVEKELDRARLLLELSDVASFEQYKGDAIDLNEKSLEIFRSQDDLWGISIALESLSSKYIFLGKHEESRDASQEALHIQEQLGGSRGICRLNAQLGLTLLHLGQNEKSETHLRRSLTISRELNNLTEIIAALGVLGMNLLFSGRFEECILAGEEVYGLYSNLGVPPNPIVDMNIAVSLLNLGRPKEAREKSNNDLERYKRINQKWGIAFAHFNLGRIALYEEALQTAVHYLEQSVDSLNEMNERSLLPEVQANLVYAYLLTKNRDDAISMLIEALRITIENGSMSTMRSELPAMALLLALDGESERAVEIYESALQSPFIANSVWYEQVIGKQIQDTAVYLDLDSIKAAKTRGRERNLWTTVNQLLEELTQ